MIATGDDPNILFEERVIIFVKWVHNDEERVIGAIKKYSHLFEHLTPERAYYMCISRSIAVRLKKAQQQDKTNKTYNNEKSTKQVH